MIQDNFTGCFQCLIFSITIKECNVFSRPRFNS